MGKCLDFKGCGFDNRESARFCSRCGIPSQGTVLLGRYVIQSFIGKDRGTVTLQAYSQQTEQ